MAQLSPEDSKALTGNIAGIACVTAVAAIAAYLLVDRAFCYLLGFC